MDSTARLPDRFVERSRYYNLYHVAGTTADTAHKGKESGGLNSDAQTFLAHAAYIDHRKMTVRTMDCSLISLDADPAKSYRTVLKKRLSPADKGKGLGYLL